MTTISFSVVPAKLVRDWKTLLIAGQPLYPQEEGEGGRDSVSRLSQSTCSVLQSDVARDALLDETDFWQYRVGTHSHTHWLTSMCVCIRMWRLIG